MVVAMSFSLSRTSRWRYVVPVGAIAVAAGVAVPQLASGTAHPPLPPRTAAQLLASLHGSKLPQFTGTVVTTTDLGLPDISSAVENVVPGAGDGGGVTQAVSLLTGSHTAQLAYGGPYRQRLALFVSDLSEIDVVHNGRNVWTYSSQDNSVSHSTLPADSDSASSLSGRLPVAAAEDPRATAQRLLARIDPATRVTVQRTAEVAGRSAYQLVLQPRSADSLIRSVSIAVDSATSMPLRVQVWARGLSNDPAFQVAFTTLHLGAPSASTFNFTKPHGAVMKANPLAPAPGPGGVANARMMTPVGPVGHSAVRAPQAHPAPGAHVPPRLLKRAAASPHGDKVSAHVIGKGWTAVLTGRMPANPSAADTAGQL